MINESQAADPQMQYPEFLVSGIIFHVSFFNKFGDQSPLVGVFLWFALSNVLKHSPVISGCDISRLRCSYTESHCRRLFKTNNTTLTSNNG